MADKKLRNMVRTRERREGLYIYYIILHKKQNISNNIDPPITPRLLHQNKNFFLVKISILLALDRGGNQFIVSFKCVPIFLFLLFSPIFIMINFHKLHHNETDHNSLFIDRK